MDFKDTIAWYDDNAEYYAGKTYENSSTASVDTFCGALPEGAAVLDAGCGAGKHSGWLTERGVKVTGIDISAGLLAEAQKRHPDIAFVQGDFTKLPFADQSFDGVFATASLVHLETVDDVTQALSEFERVLVPGGVVFIKVKLQTGQNETEIVSDTLSGHERFFRYYTSEGLRELLLVAGLTVYKEHKAEDKFGRSQVQWIEVLARKKT